MRTIITLLLLTLAPIARAQTTLYVPPDLYDEDYKKSIGFWENLGQIIDTDGDKRDDILFYSEGGFPRIYAQKKSKVSFVVARVDTSVSTVDTLYRLDMRPYGATANQVSPIAVVQKDWFQNFYLPHCGSTGAEDVHGYSRLVYKDIFPSIDMHFYSGSVSQKMAFVLRPGCVPGNLKLAFEGQDSIAVDLWGNLKLYKQGRYFVIPYVQAYQVNTAGTIIPVNWSASYQVNNGTGIVSFSWSSYNSAWPLVFQMGIPPLGSASYDEEGLCWSTYFGGDGEDFPQESTQDEADGYYVAGQTFSSFTTFPQAPGTNYSQAGQVSYSVKFDGGDNISWKTFFGGSMGEQTWTTGMLSKPEAGVYLVGFTSSESLPVFQQTGGPEFYQATATGPNNKGFICRLNRGTGYRDWATYFGSNNVQINDAVLVGNHRICVVGETYGSLPQLDTSPPSGSTFWDYSAFYDGFIGMFNDDDQFVWRTYLPGAVTDRALAVMSDGTSVVVSGTTYSPDMHTQSNGLPGCYSVGPLGDDDSFINEFTVDGAFLWGTYVGTPVSEFHACAGMDPATGDVVLLASGGDDLDVVPGPNWYLSDPGPTGTYRAIMARFSGSNRARTWHTYFHNGTGGTYTPRVSYFDQAGNLFIGGQVRGGAGLLLQPLSGTYQQSAFVTDTYQGGSQQSDAMMVCFGPGNIFLWGTYLGGEASIESPEQILTILRRSVNGNIYVAGVTSKDTDPLSYFPLDDAGGDPYFEDIWQGGIREGFLTAFCGQSIVGVMEPAFGVTLPQLICSWRNEALYVEGFASGVQSYAILDALGRQVLSGQIVGTTRTMLMLPHLAQGTYAVSTSNGTGRFSVIR